MAGDISPLPIRHANMLPRSLPPGRSSLAIEDIDELSETIPCSPGAVMRHGDTTQPTQMLSRPTLESSSPPSVVEVPASSPFQAPPKRPTFGSRLAPAGTVFRPPPRPQPQSVVTKRPAPETIEIASSDDDDDDDLLPPRGDIRPTTFKAQIATYAYNPQADAEKKRRQKLRQIYDVYGNRFPADKVREALQRTNEDVEDAIAWLEKNLSAASSRKKPAPVTNNRRLTSKAALEPVRRPTVAPSPPKQAPRRRLVKGLKPRSSPSSQRSVDFPSSDDPIVIDLVDNDKEDDYKAERSPSPDEDGDDQVLKCINSSTLKELGAMTGMKEALLELIIEKRPFISLTQARRVSSEKKPGQRKSARVSIGETVVDAVEVFLNAVSAIDVVVSNCETKANMVKGSMEHWDLDTFGRSRSTRSTPDLPPTPTSANGIKYHRPPIARQPKYLDGHCTMRPFQLFGLNWMSLLYNFDIGCILADEMGLGKTCQVISFISHLVETYEYNHRRHDRRPWPNLIVVPPSTYNNWLGEFERFAPDISVIGYRGSQAERAEIADEVENEPDLYHVVLATYSQINSDEDVAAMQAMHLNAAIFDEGHKMKNPETKIYRDLQRIPASWKMLLTGTPVQNNLLEMTSLLNFINPQLFAGQMEHIKYIFSQKVNVRDVSNGAFLYKERVNRARTILEPFILQRRKDQVLSDMPRKICTLVYCDMTESQKPVYDEYEKTFRTEPSQRKLKAGGRQNDQNNVWMQLRKAAIHPLLFRRYFTDEIVAKMGRLLMDHIPQSELHQPDIKHLIEELKQSSDFELHLWCRDYPALLGKFDYPMEAEMDSGKVKKLLELVEGYQKNGDRVLVFSKFSRVIELLQEVLAVKDIDHRVLMGNTNVAERQTLIDEFNDDASIPVFLLTTGAGGTGINLTAANKVIIFDQSDNPQDDIQAENRAHRLGQQRSVEVIRLLSSHTLEELIYKACQKKIELANKVTGATEEEGQSGTEGNMEQEVRKLMNEQMTPP